MRAGITGFQKLPYLDNFGQPVIGAMVPDLAPTLRRTPRLITMLSRALAELLEKHLDLKTDQIPFIVGLAEPDRPGVDRGATEAIIQALQEKLRIQFHPKLSKVVRKGHTAGFEGLQSAREMMANSEVSSCIVAGVDSYVNAAALLWLEQHSRLKAPQNSNGVIPGEAAAAVLVQRQVPARAIGVRVAGLGFAQEKVHVLSEEPFLGLGLAEATRKALGEAGQPLHAMDFRLSDVTGESYGFKEQALVLARVMRGRRPEFPLWHCSDSIGDTGAAAGICHLIHAANAFKKGYSPGDNAIGFTSNVAGDRAVVILQRTGVNETITT